MLRIGLDLDQTVCDFMNPYLDRFGTPKKDSEITKHVMNELRRDREFWLSLPIINVPNFQVALYCTSRVNKKAWNIQFIQQSGLPKAPVYQVYGYGLSKASRIKGRVDVFIDDSIHNFEDLNANGVPCLLMDSEFNRHYETPFRIYSLDLEEITNTLNLMK